MGAGGPGGRRIGELAVRSRGPRSPVRRRALLTCCVFALPFRTSAQALMDGDLPPFVVTPARAVERMLAMAQVGPDDTLIDLGSGDGRIVIRAASKYGIRAIGIEMDRILLEQARKAARVAGVTRLVEFRAQDALQTDLSEATIVTLYMLPWFNEKIKPNLQKYLRPGARIVAHDFAIAGWQPDKIVRLPEIEQKPGGYRHQHVLYLWQVRR